MDYDFSYLSEPFKGWYEKKSQEQGQSFIHTENPIEYLLSEHETLYAKLGMTQDSFEEAFLKPYYKLIELGCFNFGTISEITEIISKVIGKAVIIQKGLPNEPFSLIIDKSPDRYAMALDWTYTQVKELKLAGLDMPETHLLLDQEPILQCRYCGKLDADDKGRKFNKKRRYCHDKHCKETKSVNPEHHIDCCYGKWAKRKKLLIQTLKRHYRGREKGISNFKIFCNELHDHALTIHSPIRTSGVVMIEFLESIGVNTSAKKNSIHGIEAKDSYLLMKKLLSEGKA